jgi:hypothetical protein
MRRLLALSAAVVMILALAAPAAAASARITLIHGIPGATVNVEVDGAVVVKDFSFGDKVSLNAFSGTTLKNVEVTSGGSIVIAGGDIALASSGNYSVIAHLDASGTPKLSVFQNDVSKIAASKGRVTARHTAAAGAVDVLADGAVLFAGLTNGGQGKADVAAKTYALAVTPAGGGAAVLSANLGVGEGQSRIVYVVGSAGAGYSFLTETIGGLGTSPSSVPSGNSPVDNGFPMAALFGLVALALLGTAGGLTLVRREK